MYMAFDARRAATYFDEELPVLRIQLLHSLLWYSVPISRESSLIPRVVGAIKCRVLLYQRRRSPWNLSEKTQGVSGERWRRGGTVRWSPTFQARHVVISIREGHPRSRFGPQRGLAGPRMWFQAQFSFLWCHLLSIRKVRSFQGRLAASFKSNGAQGGSCEGSGV